MASKSDSQSNLKLKSKSKKSVTFEGMVGRGAEKKLVAAVREEEMMDVLPSPGYRFVPTDQELIRYYLRPKIAKRNLPRWNVITDRDLYGEEEPSEIFQGKSVNEMYFFTLIKKKYQNGKNIDRVIAGKGAWKAQGTKEVFDRKKLMGFKTTLNFVSNKMPANKNSKTISWIMHEYTLLTEDDQRCALCRIKRGRGNTTDTGSATGGVGGVSPPRFLMSGLTTDDNDNDDDDDNQEEEEEDNKLAATAALYKMSARANLEKGNTRGEIQPAEVQQLSDESGSEDSTFKDSSDSNDDNQPNANAPIPKEKGMVFVDDSEPLSNYVGSPKRYKRRTNDAVKNNLTAKFSNVLTTNTESSKDNPNIASHSRTQESLAPSSVIEPTFDIVNVDYNKDILPNGVPISISSKVSLPPRNDVHNVKGAAAPDDLMQVIADSYDRIQLAGITFSSKYYSLEKQYQNLQGHCAELESELARMKKELSEKDSVISEKDWENKTLHVVLRNEKAGYKRKLEGIQADSEKMIDGLKVQLGKAKKTKYSKLSDLSPKPVRIDNASCQSSD